MSTTRWAWPRRLTQHICGHTSVQTDYRHLDENFWRFQRRGSPIPQQTWPSELMCSSKINSKQRDTAGAPYGAQWYMWSLSVVPHPCGASTPNSTALNLWTGAWRRTLRQFTKLRNTMWFTQRLDFYEACPPLYLIWFLFGKHQLGELKPVNRNFLYW